MGLHNKGNGVGCDRKSLCLSVAQFVREEGAPAAAAAAALLGGSPEEGWESPEEAGKNEQEEAVQLPFVGEGVVTEMTKV